MANQVELNVNVLPKVTTVGSFGVDQPWIHGTRHLNINTMIYVLKGTVYVKEEGIEYEVAEDHTFFFKSGCLQTGSRTIQPGSKWYWVSFESNHGESHQEGQSVDLPKITDCSKFDQISHTLRRMEEVYVSDMPYKSSLLDACLYKVFLELLNRSVRQSMDAKSKRITPKVIQLLNKQLEEKFSSVYIADHLKMNYSYISRKFKEETGMSINQYYMKLKIDQAINLLHTSDMNIAEISNSLNYPNPYYFSRVFKKITGMSPSDYKQQMY